MKSFTTILLSAFSLSALAVAAPRNTLYARAQNSTVCDGQYGCAAGYGFTADGMAQLNQKLQSIPNDGVTLTTACDVIDCVENLCAWPSANGYGWANVLSASSQIIAHCGQPHEDATNQGCGISSFTGLSVDAEGGLRYGYVASPNNQKGGKAC